MDTVASFRAKAVAAAGVVAAVTIGLFLLWYAADLFLLAFLSILTAIFLRSLSNPLAKRIHCSERMSLWILIVLIVIGVLALGWLFSGDVVRQFETLSQQVPEAIKQLRQSMERTDAGRRLSEQSSELGQLWQRPGVLSRATGILTATFGFFSSMLVVVVGGIFLAHNPKLYLDGAVRLVSPSRRRRAREVLESLYQTMRWWLLGKSISMIFVGLVTGIGLRLLGVQLALVLGLLAGALAFIPFVGPLLSLLPAVLLALVDDPRSALYVLLLYLGIQMLEGNILTPIVERKTVFLPPALTIFSQLLAALLFGFLGVLLASPLTAVGMILVKMLYIEDVLEQSDSSSISA